MINIKCLIYSAALLAAFILSQYFFFNYFFMLKVWNYFMYIYYFVLALLFYVGWKRNLNLLYFISIIFLAIAWNSSYELDRSLVPLFFYALFYLSFFASYLTSNRREENMMVGIKNIYDKSYSLKRHFFIIMAVAMAIIAFHPYFIMNIFIEQTANIKNQPMFGISSAETILAYLFSTPKVWLLTALYITILLAGSLYFLQNKVKNEYMAILFLVLMAFAAKFISVLVMYNNTGFKWMADIITNKHITDYYVYTKDIDSISIFVKDYILYQSQQMGIAQHMRTHPPLVAVLFWVFCKMTSCTPVAVGLTIMALTSFTSAVIYYIVKMITNNKEAAFIGGILYLVSGNSIIQSRIIMDSIVTFFFGLVVVFIIASAKYKNIWFSLIAGLLFGMESYLQFGAWLQLLIIFPLFFVERKINVSNLLHVIKYGLLFVVGILIFHIMFPVITFSNFNYIHSFKVAQSFLNGDNVGVTYTTWWWLNSIHLFRYVGSGVAALLIIRFWNAFTGKIKLDGYSFVCLGALIIYILSALVRGLLAWKFMFLIIIIVPAAVLALFTKTEKEMKYNKFYFLIITTLMYCETMAYLFMVQDAQ